ncbi:hypothetical protein FOCC_FOCC015194 [Frankliniella occidentalis]|nr:hypothetical protein FOCC_FOCC015194 [Frankliniella occidentalis]
MGLYVKVMASPTKKRVRVATAEVLADRSALENVSSIKWERCCLCQRPNEVKSLGTLKSPMDHVSKETRLAGYKTIVEQIQAFREIGHLPSSVRYEALSVEGMSILDTMIAKKARWHKNCELKINRTELARIKQRQKKLDDLTARAESSPVPSPVKRRLTRSVGSPALSVLPLEEKCFVCGEVGTWSKGLCKVSTVDVEQKVSEVAEKTSDNDIKAQLVALLANGPLRAQESMYHPACLSKLYRTIKLPPSELGEESGTKQSVRACEAMAFADVVASVQERSMPSSTDFIFPMTALTKLYQQRLAQLLGVGTADLPSVHTTRLREKFQESFPHLRLERPSQEYVFVKGKFAPVLVPQYEMDLDVIAFKRFVRELRTEMLGNPVTFSGSLRRDEQAAKTPATLGAVNMLLYGPGAVDMDRATQPALSLAQLLHFNTLARQPRGYGVRHVKEKETLLPVFLSLSAYARTRSKELVKELHALGLGISPTRVYEITSSLCYLTVIRAEEEGFLCPAELRRGLFTIAALDNVDHNPSSSTAKGSFHGTGISVFQVPTKQCPGEHRTFKTTYVDVPQSRTDVPDLPDSYAVVPSVVLRSRKPATPAAHPGTGESMVAQSEAWEERQTAWLSHVRNVVHGGEHGLDLTWAAFNATNFSSESDTLPIVNTLLPLFEEVAETPSMVKHGFDIVTKITNMVNPGQTPTICMDQPLFALGKILQCNWPQTYGESKIVLLMGGLHIEQAFLRLLGTFMDECGWAEIATHAGITSSEAGAEALLKVHHIKKSRAAHEATAAALYILLEKAHTELCDTEATMSEWAQEQVDSPTFYFWWTVLKLELLLLSFVGSLRSSTYDRYLSSIKQMLPHFFSWDKINYARWLTVHLTDLLELPHTAPDVHSAFTKGFFSLAKTREPFTRMSPDQVHEQNNKLVKGQGGAIGLTEDRQSLMRWMLAGPEVQKLVNEFSPTKINAATEGLETRHDQYSAIQSKTFADYWLKDFKPNLLREAANLGKQRLDLAWDMYSPSSLKRATRQKRGSGQKMQVLLKTLLPKNWKNFLLNDDNKTGLFKLLAEQSLNLSPELLVVTNVGDKFFASQTAGTQLAGLPCYYEASGLREDAKNRLSWHRCTHERPPSPKGMWDLDL